MLEEANKKVIKLFRITNAIFEDSVNYYDSDMELHEFGESLIVPLPVENCELRLSKENTKKALKIYTKRIEECDLGCPDLDEYLILNSQIEDEIFRGLRLKLKN